MLNLNHIENNFSVVDEWQTENRSEGSLCKWQEEQRCNKR